MVNVPSPAISIVGRHNSGKTTLIVKPAPSVIAGSFSRKSGRRGQKRSICEEYWKVNFFRKNLNWGNADGNASGWPRRSSRTHISAFFVHERQNSMLNHR